MALVHASPIAKATNFEQIKARLWIRRTGTQGVANDDGVDVILRDFDGRVPG